jgi:hypothetical protein
VSSLIAIDYAKDHPDRGYLMKLKKGMYAFTGRQGANKRDAMSVSKLSMHMASLEKQISETSDLPVEAQLKDWFSKPTDAALLL